MVGSDEISFETHYPLKNDGWKTTFLWKWFPFWGRNMFIFVGVTKLKWLGEPMLNPMDTQEKTYTF